MGVDLGEELSRHRVRPGLIGLFVVACAVAAFCLAVVHPVGALLALGPLGWLGRELAIRGADRLTVHRKGFALRHRGRTRACRWQDIAATDVRLGWDRRPRLRAVTRRDGERIVFGPLMGGLAVLHYRFRTRGGRDVPAPPVAHPEGIGALLDVHPAEPRPGSLWAGWFIAGALLCFALFLLYVTIDVPDRDASDIAFAAACTAAGLGGVGGIAFLAFGDRHDELRRHEHGFAYRRRGVVRSCRWDEIVDFQRSRQGAITSVRRADGTWISLSGDVPAVERFVKPRAVRRPDHSPPPGL
jgi:hypothetical protein